MNWLRVIALLVLVAHLRVTVRADDDPQPPERPALAPIYEADAPPPEKSAPLIWHYQGAGARGTPGRWYTDEQVDRNAARIWTLEDELAKSKTATAEAEGKARMAEQGLVLGMPKWFWIGTGLLVGIGVGVAIGYGVWHHSSTPPATTTTPLRWTW